VTPSFIVIYWSLFKAIHLPQVRNSCKMQAIRHMFVWCKNFTKFQLHFSVHTKPLKMRWPSSTQMTTSASSAQSDQIIWMNTTNKCKSVSIKACNWPLTVDVLTARIIINVVIITVLHIIHQIWAYTLTEIILHRCLLLHWIYLFNLVYCIYLFCHVCNKWMIKDFTKFTFMQ
jgi:hypothetical protein